MDKELLLERLERLAFVLDQIMPRCAGLVRDAISLLKEPEVVRCKECKFWQSMVSRIIDDKEEWHLCEMVKDYKPADWFCADGERKEGR